MGIVVASVSDVVLRRRWAPAVAVGTTFMKAMLMSFGLEVDIANDGRSGLLALSSHHYDLVLSGTVGADGRKGW